MNFTAFFHTATKLSEPFPYQDRLAAERHWPNLLNVPTGLGKTAAVTLAWLYKRGWREGVRDDEAIDPNTPRRLIWCLPMRVLVEQTERNVSMWLTALGIHGKPGEGKVSVHLLMGGEPDLTTWADHPEEDMILIGTQDMLLSRALMRGYGMSRYQWPVHFALLHNDALWAFDEVQLMGAGLTTSAQLDAFRRTFPSGRGSHSLWLSATLNREWLRTIDLAPHLQGFTTHELDDADRASAGDRLNAVKTLRRADLTLGNAPLNKAGLNAYLDDLAAHVLGAHETGTRTLVIVNRVDRAQGLFQRLRKHRPDAAGDLLIHARFRAADRERIETALRDDSTRDRIIVATQAIEAGVDLSSKTLITELAPWASLVQRFGRCNRYGEHSDATVCWIDTAPTLDDKDLKPYDRETLDSARDKLSTLIAVGPQDLPPTDEPPPLTPVLRRKDLLDLFNTDPDLSGFDVDVSDYIRDSDSPGLHVFWRDFVEPNGPEPQPQAGRKELCPISMGQAKSLGKISAWRWDSLAGTWQQTRDPRPGQTLMLNAVDGAYDPQLGFHTDSKGRVAPIPEADRQQRQRFDADWRSESPRPVLLTAHLAHVAKQARDLCDAIGETEHAPLIARAGRWHDLGKAHDVFAATMHSCEEAPTDLLAKSPCRNRHKRPQFRHELASALAWLKQHDDPAHPDPDTDLIAYLVAAHHGKVRMSLRAMPTEKPAPNGARFARGIWEGDQLPALDFDGEHCDAHTLSLALMEIGDGPQGRSWAARALDLLDRHGPFRLAWLESLVRIADWRASAAEQAGTNEGDVENSPHPDHNSAHELANQHPTLAGALPGAEAPTAPARDPAQGGEQHGLRGRAGGSGNSGTRTQTPDHATREIETTLGVISYAELAPELAMRVERVAVAITAGEFADHPLDENLLREFHRRLCGDLTPQFAGIWRSVDVLVGTHSPPEPWRIAPAMRDFMDDLAARLQHLPPTPDDAWLEALAFAEGRLLGIHPFQDFNGRTTRLFLDWLTQRLDLPDVEPIPSFGAPTDAYLAALRAADYHDFRPLMAIWRTRLEEAQDD
ncbi:MAG: CRISPR-associated helicase Cas3' [Gammaproteobacteria bacterium]|nr:CRISPR-associated helicase Cas3' [Gammaproteobacteria bacterium]MCP5135265.1 CRISPR-associated helicase Cas3' [Gammaproteobacteria bacterium]